MSVVRIRDRNGPGIDLAFGHPTNRDPPRIGVMPQPDIRQVLLAREEGALTNVPVSRAGALLLGAQPS